MAFGSIVNNSRCNRHCLNMAVTYFQCNNCRRNKNLSYGWDIDSGAVSFWLNYGLQGIDGEELVLRKVLFLW